MQDEHLKAIKKIKATIKTNCHLIVNGNHAHC